MHQNWLWSDSWISLISPLTLSQGINKAQLGYQKKQQALLWCIHRNYVRKEKIENAPNPVEACTGAFNTCDTKQQQILHLQSHWMAMHILTKASNASASTPWQAPRVWIVTQNNYVFRSFQSKSILVHQTLQCGSYTTSETWHLLWRRIHKEDS